MAQVAPLEVATESALSVDQPFFVPLEFATEAFIRVITGTLFATPSARIFRPAFQDLPLVAIGGDRVIEIGEPDTEDLPQVAEAVFFEDRSSFKPSDLRVFAAAEDVSETISIPSDPVFTEGTRTMKPSRARTWKADE